MSTPSTEVIMQQASAPENRTTNHDYEIATREQAEEYGAEILGLGLERRTLPVNYDRVRIWSQTWQKVRLPYEIETAILRPLLINEDATPFTLTAKNTQELATKDFRPHFLREHSKMGYAARTIFWTHNTIALEPEAFPGWHLSTGEYSAKTFDRATILKLPPMWVRENLCTRLHFFPCCAKSKREDKEWMLQRDRDIWQALKDVTNGKFGFKKLQRLDVFFEASPSRMRFPGWTADFIVQGKTKKLDLEGCDMSIKELEKAVADRQAGWIRWKELPGFILRRKEAKIEKPSTSSRQEVALDEFGLPVDWMDSDDDDNQGDDDAEYSDREDDGEPDEVHDTMY